MEAKTLTILVVEDEAPLLEALSDKLDRENFRVLRARNGEEGLNFAQEQHPDLILLDIIMPVMDGLTMLKKLRDDAWGKDARVIMLTNLSEGKKVDQVTESGVYEYLVKTNWSLKEVVRIVKDRLDVP